MTTDGVKPKGEKLREAVRWLSQSSPITRDRIEEAAAQFDLSPLEAEFLMREFFEHPE